MREDLKDKKNLAPWRSAVTIESSIGETFLSECDFCFSEDQQGLWISHVPLKFDVFPFFVYFHYF